MKKLITEREVFEAWKQRRTKIILSSDGIITPAAAEAAKFRNISLLKSPESAATAPQHKLPDVSRIVLGCDHGGFDLKIVLIEYLQELGVETEDVGTFSTASVDYPDYAHLVAQKVARDLSLLGIIVDGAGVGSAMVANKVPGVRAAACYDVHTARNSREHNFANILTLGSRVTGVDIAKEIVRTWLQTGPGAERHKRRVDKIMQIDRKYRRA